MYITIERSAATRRSSTTRRIGAAAAVAVAAAGVGLVAGGQLSASEEGGGGAPPPAGEQVSDIPTGVDFATPLSGDSNLIVTGGSNFDETILTKYIAAANFQTRQGEAAANENDTNGEVFNSCVEPGSDSGGTVTEFRAPVELPDGARINRLHFYGFDNAATDINVSLNRIEYDTDVAVAPATTRDSQLVTAFSTSGADADGVAFSSADDLAEITGSFSVGSPAITSFANRFHTIKVTLANSAASNHQLCGVRVDYQVPASTVEAGDGYHPIGPIRAYDSRQSSFTPNGILTPGSNRVVDITDGYDLDGDPVPAEADIVPANATAVTYNITVAGSTGSNFVSVTAGDATAFTTSAINFAAGTALANAGTVTISDGGIKLWAGDGPGSAHVIIDITGYYAPGPESSNMGN